MSIAWPFPALHPARSVESASSRAATFNSVVVLVTTPAATLLAVEIAQRLGRSLDVEVTALTVQSPVSLPAGRSSLETADAEVSALLARIRAVAHMRIRVVVARTVVEALARLLPPQSLVVVGGRRHWWWPTTTARLCRAIEALGHFVVFVDEDSHAA